tara:strand:- start:175 stop:726 length:552 start_codon:yes stop_codon:yes gene_type:complete
MKSCEQTKNLNVLEHGFSVARYFSDLYNHIKNKKELKNDWKLPDWIYDSFLWENILDKKTIIKYQIYHDCGKPYCINYDDEGKKHFPNHAEVSSKIWKKLNPNDKVISELILKDMDIHITKPKDYKKISETPYWATQIITGLCELHSNASMFGGIESTSFKIKYKNLNKLSKRILEDKKEESF